MKSVGLCLSVLFAFCLASPALAVSKFRIEFGKVYADEGADEEFTALFKKARCYVCHVKGEKKEVRNDYGQALHEAIEETEFPVKDFEKDPDKYREQLVAIFKEAEKMKTGDEEHKTFGARIEANLLPGGNVEGKKD